MKLNPHKLLIGLWLIPIASLSQIKKKQDDSAQKESKVHVKVFRDEDGQSTLIDTSFETLAEAKAAMREMMGKKSTSN